MGNIVTATLELAVGDSFAEVGTLSIVAPETPVPCDDIAEAGWHTVAFEVYGEDMGETEVITGVFASAVEVDGKVTAMFEIGMVGGSALILVVDPAWVAYVVSVVSDDFVASIKTSED